MSDEGYKIQYSVKSRGGDMLNVRADDAEEFGLTVQAMVESESEVVQSLVEEFGLVEGKPKKKKTKKASKKSRRDDDDDDDDDEEEDDEEDEEDEDEEKPRKKKRSSRSSKSKSKSKSRR